MSDTGTRFIRGVSVLHSLKVYVFLLCLSCNWGLVDCVNIFHLVLFGEEKMSLSEK